MGGGWGRVMPLQSYSVGNSSQNLASLALYLPKVGSYTTFVDRECSGCLISKKL